MAPGNKERHTGHTGTIPKTKVRNNCNVPQEAVTPTRRDMASNLVTTSLDWVPVSEYNARSNCNQSRKQTNNTSDQESTDLDNSVSFESGFGRFVPVRPQPRALPLTVQNRESLTTDHHDDGASSSHNLHPYAHQMSNGMIPHSNHAAAAVMIVNPTTPNAVTGNMTQQLNVTNQNRNNLTRNLNSTRNTFEGNNTNNNNPPPVTNSRSGTKSVNLINNMYDQGHSSFNNINENNQAHRESARALGEAIVAACPDAAAVERRLGQIREYIRVTSSLVDTMRNSEDEQDVVVRPVSVQSNASAYSENELWQNEIKNKMEMSQIRLSALKQQQKRLLKYQAEAKQQLEEINKERQAQEMNHPSTSHENFNEMQNLTMSTNYHNQNRMYGANQIGVATTLPQAGDLAAELEHARAPSVHSRDERFSLRDGNVASSEEAAGGTRDSEVEDDDVILSERERILQLKLRELQMKKQHMENLVSEFQKLQMATRVGSSHNTYSSSGEDSGDEEASRKCNKSGVNLKNEDPFKLMEIKAIKTALQKTKDLMRSVETFEGNLPGAHEDNFHVSNLSNIHDNKSEGGGSMGGWSNEDSVCRVRNSLSQRHKFTNEQHSQQQLQPQQHLQQSQHQQHLQQTQAQQHLQQLQHLQQTQHQHHLQQAQHQQQLQQAQHQQHLQQTQHMQLQQHQQHMQAPQHPQHSQQNHEANINTLQELAQELRMETEKIMGERARIKDMVINKERKQKKVNEVRGGCVGPAERRQLQLRALLADKQRELEALLNKEAMSNATETQNIKPDSRVGSVVNQSYNSEQEEPESRSEHVQMDSQNSRDNDNFRSGDSALGSRSVNTAPSHLGSGYGSDSDSASRNKSNQRNRPRRRPTLDRQSEDNNLPLVNNSNSNVRHEPRVDSNVNMVPPVAQNNDNTGNSHLPPCWNTTKSNQDMRTNQFTQNSHSQTMDRLMGTPMSFPPTMPFSMMMPYGMVGCGCGCGLWGAWCWQQLALQQREIHQLRDQLAHLEERWRAETASHTLNNQVPPGNRANNYWDNFRSYSRQNLLSGSSKSNAEAVGGGVGVGGGPGCGAGSGAAPLAERSHNSLHHTSSSSSPSLTPKRNTEEARLSSAPDVLNVNQNEPELVTRRNLNCADPIPEIVQSHSNLDSPAECRRKSSKLPSKNSASRRNYAPDFPPTGDVTATAEAPNPNLASASRELRDKATSKLFDLLRENIYSEVTTLIGVNESHPDFLIQLFRELQLISSDPLRQRVLQSIRSVLSQYSNFIESRTEEADSAECTNTTVTTTSVEPSDCQDCSGPSVCTSTVQIDNRIVRFLLLKSEEIFTSELLESLASLILNNSSDGRQLKRLLDLLSKYEGMRVCDVSSDIVENMPIFNSVSNEGDESIHMNEIPESSILQDVAGSLNLFSSSEGQLHQMNTCPYDMWPGHIHMDIDGGDTNAGSTRSSQEGKVDLINCSEMHNGDLAEADQTCHAEAGDSSGNTHDDVGNAEALPDVVDTEEVTPTEAEAEWLGLDRVPTRLHMEESSEKQKGDI